MNSYEFASWPHDFCVKSRDARVPAIRYFHNPCAVVRRHVVSYEFVVSGQDSRARSEEPSRRLGSLASRFFFVHGEMDGHDARTDTCCHRMPDAACDVWSIPAGRLGDAVVVVDEEGRGRKARPK